MNIPVDNPRDDSIAPRLLVSVGIIIGISFPIYCTRIYSRCRPQYKLSWDDYAITVAQICSIVGYVFIALSCKYGLGRHTILVSEEDRSNAMFYFFIQVPVWYWGIAMMRTSVALLLLRLKSSPAWDWMLRIMISVQIIVAITGTIWSVTFCLPVRSEWEYVPNAKCGSTHAMQAFGYAYSAISITSDLTFSLMPLTFIWRLRRPVLERVVVGVLMCMGFTASTAAIIKLTKMFYQSYSGDLLRNLLVLNMWCKLEESIGIAAASIPYLKSPTEQLFQRIKLVGPFGRHEPSSKGNGRQPFHVTVFEDGLESNSESEVGRPYGRNGEFELGQADTASA